MTDEKLRDSEGATCHVCDGPASFLVEMIDQDSPLGSAIYPCGEDHSLATEGSVEQIAVRLATTYETPVEECRGDALLMTSETGRSVPCQPSD